MPVRKSHGFEFETLKNPKIAASQVVGCVHASLQVRDQRGRVAADYRPAIKPADSTALCLPHPVIHSARDYAALGHHVIALSSWFHYGLGVTIGQVQDILGAHLHTEVTAGGLVDGWGRLAERISKHRDQLFTFLETVGVPPDNNYAERQLRSAVIIRKNSLCNRPEAGARTQAVLMSVYRTLCLRGIDPTKAIASALRTLLQTGTLPPLPAENVADG